MRGNINAFMQEVYDLTYGMLSVMHYNRRDVMPLCDELDKRIRYAPCIWSDDGNIIYGILIMQYGDYGTSPRSGWFKTDQARDAALYAVHDFVKECKEES